MGQQQESGVTHLEWSPFPDTKGFPFWCPKCNRESDWAAIRCTWYPTMTKGTLSRVFTIREHLTWACPHCGFTFNSQTYDAKPEGA